MFKITRTFNNVSSFFDLFRQICTKQFLILYEKLTPFFLIQLQEQKQ